MASVFSTSTSATLRMNSMHKDVRSQKMFVCFNTQTSVPFPKCSFKLYMVPLNSIHGRLGLRRFTLDNFSEDGIRHPERHVVSSVLSSNSSQRSGIIDESFMSSSGSLNDLEEQLQELFDEVKTMIKLGKEDDAIDLLEANYEAVREQVDSGVQSIEEAAVLDVIALGYMALGDLKAVGSVMDVLHKIVDALNNEELFLDSILMHMGNIYAKLEKFEFSVCSYRRSLQIMERKYGSKSSFLCTPLLGMATALGTSGRASEAIETYKRVIKILESSRGESEELVVPLCALGNLQMKEGKTSDAEYTFSRVLKIYMKLFGEKDGRVGIAMRSLAQVKCAKGEVDKAIDLYKNSLQILRDSEHVAVNDEVMEKMRIDLAELLHVVGRKVAGFAYHNLNTPFILHVMPMISLRGDEGRALLEECFLISEKSKGKEHPSLVPHLVNLATSYSRSKNYAEAERLLRISLQIMTKNMPPDDPSITFPMLHLAVTLYNLHRDDEAERVAADVLRIREKAFGNESLPVGEALDCLVSIRSRLEKDESELVELLKRVLKIQEKAFGQDSEEVMETMKKLLHYLDKMGLKDEKYPLQRRLSLLANKYKQMVKL